MWSRREFIFSVLSSHALWWAGNTNQLYALDNKYSHAFSKLDPRLFASESWPPAISGNFIDTFADNLCCILNDMGTLETADILSSAKHSHIYPILGEINNLGNKIIYLKTIQPQKAVVIAGKQDNKDISTTNLHYKKADRNETGRNYKESAQFVCHWINLSLSQSPHIVSSTILSDYSQISLCAANTLKNRNILCIAGLDKNGDNRISLYSQKGKGKLQILASFKIMGAPKSIGLASDTLLILYETQQASIYNLFDIAKPQFIRTVKLTDQITNISYYDDTCAWTTRQGSEWMVALSNLKNFPHITSKAKVDDLLSIEAICFNDKYLLTLGSNDQNSSVVSFKIDKNLSLKQQDSVPLFGYEENISGPSKMVLGKDAAFISSGWPGMQVLSLNNNDKWLATTCYSAQKLPITGFAVWSNYLLLGGAELQLYDLKQAKRPKLIKSAKLPNPVKTVVAAGSYALCLEKTQLTLRKIEDPETILVRLAISADNLSFDRLNHKAYLIQKCPSETNKDEVTKNNTIKDKAIKDTIQDKDKDKDKNENENDKEQKTSNTTVIELNVFNNSILKGKTFPVITDSYCLSADEGYVLVGNLNSLSVYKPDQEIELICTRQFKDFAWREIILSKGNIYATAIDQNVNGYFLCLSFDGQIINTISSLKLSHDAMGLIIKENLAFAIGQNIEGTSLLTTIDISNTAKPKILSSKPTLQSASAAAIMDNLVIVTGQGFEVFSI